MREFKVVIGAKGYFYEKIKGMDKAKSFLEMVRLSDAYHYEHALFQEKYKADLLILKNDDYHAITEQANDRLGGLIYDLTTDNATIWVHNPPSNLLFFLKSKESSGEITLNIEGQQYDIIRDRDDYKTGIATIKKDIIGQDAAIIEISKTLGYLTAVKRLKPYVIMLYGSSSIGKTEMVRKVAECFFGNKLFEQHLSMYRANSNVEYLFGSKPNRRSIGFDLLERESNLIFLDEFDKCPDYCYSVFYTLFDNSIFKDAYYEVNISSTLIILTSNYTSETEMRERLGLPIYYRIDKFIHFEDFSCETIHKIVGKELDDRLDEYKGYFTKDEIYSVVSKRILTSGENARTIKYKIQAVLEELLFEKFCSE